MADMGRVAVNGFERAALARLRLERGLTQEDLALRVGVGVAAVRSWEAGRSEPSPRNFLKLTVVLHVSEKDLLSEVDPLRGLAEHRRRSDLTQPQAAAKAGMRLHRLRDIERGVRIPTADEALALARIYRITAGEVSTLTTRLHRHRTTGRD